jgi:polyisoprenoid-binding protein YceI
MSRAALASVLLVLGASAAASAEPRTYQVAGDESAFTVTVGKSGLFKFAGHEHEVVAGSFTGEVVADPDDVGRSSVVLDFDAAALKVTGKDESPEDVPKVQETMAGPKVLDAARFPRITFRSRAVKGRPAAGAASYVLEVEGDLAFRDVTRPLVLEVKVDLGPDTLVATGVTVLRHSDLGLTPISIAGVVKVKNELVVSFRIVAKRH